MNKRDRDWMLEETIRAYRGLDDDALGVLKEHWPADRIRQEAIATVLAEREVDARVVQQADTEHAWGAPVTVPDKERPSITCPTCGMVSYNHNDIRERYCGHCHQFHDEMP